MKRMLTCIVCPMGCSLTVELEGKNVVSVTGNTCKRGVVYAESECTNPQRTVTSTVRCANGEMIAVKTDRPIPKEKVYDCMKQINAARPKTPIAIGDVILEDVYGSKVVATQHSTGHEV